MARKRTPKDTSPTENQSQPVEATPTSTDPIEPAATAVMEPPVPQVAETPATAPEPTFVERLTRQRNPGIASDPFGIAGDYEAGVRLFENRRERLMVIKFEQKPSTEVLSRLKDSGFRWNPREQVWVHPIYPDEARRIRIEAERTYQAARQMIREDRGLGENAQIPF